ncbi:unnamed protein product [Adineta steineri]|uniref:Uncharacterized protein n=1 Tax=Adineta steineri TaxID=433720 RepID=A0A814N6I8_9BILA|nr:unnamed protein product [Adineta steineri]CAF1137426.1 unnamed protein product [Adineta steineri]CAF3693328.1 unnamed protein product [Adineta steineri]CAF3822114.1 unnamed protein product [Adineta steineri]
MKIIIFSILFTVQAQYIDDELILNESSSITNEFNLITQIRNERTTFLETTNQFDINQTDSSTILSNTISFSSTNDFDFMTSSEQTNLILDEQWFNVNQSQRKDSYRSNLFWKSIPNSLWNGAAYTLTSEPRCVRQMCSAILKYNSTLSSNTSGCLSFTLRIRGQPVGQLWIVEDKAQDNTLQKIQLTNKTLRIEHSLRSKIKNLSIETRVLFRNPKLDTLYLSNLNIDWKGSCPKYRPVPTPSSNSIGRRSTLDDDFMTLSSEGSGFMNTLTTNEEFQSSQQDSIYESTTIIFDEEITTKKSFSFTNQKNLGWVLSLITIFCFLIILSAIGHSLWLIRRTHYFSWHLTFDTQIQLLARRSIRSSTRSENKIATISEIAYDILQTDLQKEQNSNTLTTNSSSRSTPISYYTYL